MVLFTERETMLLLDMYLRLRLRNENVAANGVLLKAPARAKLTRAINRSAGGNKNRVWTEGQVFVKFKNLRVDYAQIKWLQEQPGFRDSGEGMSKDWWADIKAQRPKAHVFKGKLPWPFFSRMAMILNDAPYVAETDAATEQRITQLLSEADDASGDAEAAADTADLDAGSASATSDDETSEPQAAPTARRAVPAAVVATTTHVTPKRARTTTEPEPEASYTPALSYNKRSRSSLGGSSSAAVSPAREERASHHESLSRSVEQCSAAAADMARGFQELVSMFQAQAEKCRSLETGPGAANADAESVAVERQMLLSIARSIEKSTQASADMARGYHDLIEHYVRESGTRRVL